MCFFASSGVCRIRPHQSQQKYSLDVKIFTPSLHCNTLTTGETINDSSAALHLRYLQVDLPKSARALTNSNVTHSWSCSECMTSIFPLSDSELHQHREEPDGGLPPPHRPGGRPAGQQDQRGGRRGGGGGHRRGVTCWTWTGTCWTAWRQPGAGDGH